MASLFDSLPSAGLRTRSKTSTTSSSSDNDRMLNWVQDDEKSNCMHCNTPFTLLTRKHHCRRCGNVICNNCSPHERRITSTDPLPMRVCNACYAAVDEHFASLEWSGQASTEISTTPDPVIDGRVHIGQIYAKVVEAIGLPSTDSITSDPFVRVILTGKWSHGQEWGSDLRSVRCTKKKSRTLNPRWHETFVFNVCAPGAELVFEVYNYGQLSQPTKLGEATIALRELMDQRRHNKWLDLLLPEKLHRAGLNNDARAGRIHVLLHYKFSRTAEFCSYFASEQQYVYEWPEFQAARLYSNFWVLLDILWPYLEVAWRVSPTLNWEYPTRSCLCFGFCVWLCLSLEWVPVVIHIALIALILRNYFASNLQSFAEGKDETTSGELSGANGHFRQYSLPVGFTHLMNKMTHVSIDQETRHSLQSVQNNMAWISHIISSIEMMFSWEDSGYTARVLLCLIASCLLHVMIPNKYLLLVLILYLFTRWTVPYVTLMHFTWALRQALRSLIHQHQLATVVEQQQSDILSSPSQNALLVPKKRNSEKRVNRVRRTPSSQTPTRSHLSVSKKEEMFGAAASAISKGITVQELQEKR
ncbi:hypothetical protein ABG067_003209 [Albugo candida]